MATRSIHRRPVPFFRMMLCALLLAAAALTASAGELATLPDPFAESMPEVDPPRDEAPQGPAPRLAPPAPPEAPAQAAPRSASAAQAAPTPFDPHSPLDTVVQVRTSAVAGGETIASLGAQRSGSGVILDASTVLTIGYLLLEADEVEIVTASGRRIPGSVAGYDHQSGFGVVRAALPLDGAPLELGDSDRVTERQKVLTLGHGELEATELIVVSRKTFAGSWEYLLDRAIFTFPPVNNWSGAALLNEDGKLVGIGSLIVNDAASDQPGVPGNMFVPVNLVKPILADLLSKGRRDGPPQAWLGLSTESVRGNLMVARVTRGSPAEQAGLAPGDIIVGVGEAGIGDQAEFYRQVWKSGPAGTIVKLRVLKGGSLQEVPVQSMDRADFLRKPSGI